MAILVFLLGDEEKMGLRWEKRDGLIYLSEQIPLSAIERRSHCLFKIMESDSPHLYKFYTVVTPLTSVEFLLLYPSLSERRIKPMACEFAAHVPKK